MTIRLNRRVEKLSREACASTVGGAKSLKATIASAPITCFDCLIFDISSLHDPKPLDRIGGVDRQRRAEYGQPVAEHAAVLLGTQADRHQGAATPGPRP